MLRYVSRSFFKVRCSRARYGTAFLAVMLVASNPTTGACQGQIPTPAVSPSEPSQRRLVERPLDEMQADIHLARGQYAAAIDAYVSLHSRSAIVWNKIGMAYHHLFALEAARRAYEQALSINPRYAPAANNLAAVYYAQQDYRHAEHYYKRALKYTSEDAVIYCNLGTAYFAEKNYNKGKKQYRKALALDQHVFAPDKASLVEATASREQRLALNYYLAQTFAALGKEEEALLYLRKAMDDGFNDRKRLEADKEFSLLRNKPKFRELLTQENMD